MFLDKIKESIDSFSSSELLILDYTSGKKKWILLYLVVAFVISLGFSFAIRRSIEGLKQEKTAAALKVFTRSEFWGRKREVPFLKTGRFRDDALSKLVPLLKECVRRNRLRSAYIVDPDSKVIWAHNDPRMTDSGYQVPGADKEYLIKGREAVIGRDPSGGLLKTEVSMFIYRKEGKSILKTLAPIPYGKSRRTVGLFILEIPFDDEADLIAGRKRCVPFVTVFAFLSVPLILSVGYFRSVKRIRREMSGYDEGNLGPYKGLKLIGEGGMGKVYKATRLLRGHEVTRQVAVKVLYENLYKKKKFMQRFANEAQMVARLGMHRNIVGLYDFGPVKIEEVESFGLEMPLIDGLTLEEVIEERNREISVGQALYICLEILNGLGHAHNLKNENNEPTPIIHRDISPKNIMLSRNGAVLIADFGISKSEELSSMTLPGELIGTFTNMSPEQANGEPVDRRSDIFSAGTVFYELIMKKKLYVSDDIRVLWGLVSRAEMPEITGIDKHLKKIILRSLAKEPDQRYRNALEMMKEIRELIHQNYRDYKFDEKDMEDFLAASL